MCFSSMEAEQLLSLPVRDSGMCAVCVTCFNIDEET